MCEYCKEYPECLIEYSLEVRDWQGCTPEVDFGIFIDRGYIRMCDLSDTNCIESGLKIEINFCPICGEKVEKLK